MPFPTALDTGSSLPNPTTSSKTNSPSHAALHSAENVAIIATETKLGIGSSTPVANTLLFGTGAGTSAWTALTSAQLAATLSDETGTGSAVFATTPTLVTPKMDTINESTPTNGVTIDGLNIKDNALNTNNSVVTANITNGAVTANKLGTGATVATVLTSETTTSTSYVDLTTVTDTVTVTVGANGLLWVSIYCGMNNSGANYSGMSFTLSGANTQAASDTFAIAFNGSTIMRYGATFPLTGLNAGSTTVKAKYDVSAGTGTFVNRRISALPL
jgi:hypothetical protein